MLPYIPSYSDSSVFYLNKVSWCSAEYIYCNLILIYEQKSTFSTSVVFFPSVTDVRYTRIIRTHSTHGLLHLNRGENIGFMLICHSCVPSISNFRYSDFVKCWYYDCKFGLSGQCWFEKCIKSSVYERKSVLRELGTLAVSNKQNMCFIHNASKSYGGILLN